MENLNLTGDINKSTNCRTSLRS